jgi:hypothetical protein
LVVGGADFIFQLCRERRIHDQLADFLAHAGKLHHIVHIKLGEHLTDAIGQAIVSEKIAVSLCSGGETARHAHAGAGELANHFAQRRIFAADGFHVGHAQLVEPDNVILCHVTNFLC